MFKNVASQKLIVFAFDSTTNLPKTGDAANLTAYVSKDYGAATALGDTSATEIDSTNAKGYYLFDLTQSETNADTLLFSAKSSTANIVVVGSPATVFTVPPNFTAASIDSSGRVDVIKIAGTTQTARDIGASVLLSAGTGAGQLDFTAGVVKSNLTQANGSATGVSEFSSFLQGIASTGADLADCGAAFSWYFSSVNMPVLVADSGTTTTIVDAALTESAADHWKGATVLILDGTIAGQTALVTAFTPGTDTLTFEPALTSAAGTNKYMLIAAGARVDAVSVSGDKAAADNLESAADGTGYNLGGGSVVAASVTGAVGSVTGNVGGNVTGSVGSLAAQAKADVNAEADTALSDYGALKPTTAGRTLDVTATGEAGIDWANIGGATTTVNLSGTTVGTVTANSDKTGYRLSATGVDDIWDEVQSGHATAGTFGLYLDSAVSGVSTGGISAADIADAVWDEARSGHVTAGTFGEYVLADATLISGDATAADNLETMLDGTGGQTLSLGALTVSGNTTFTGTTTHTGAVSYAAGIAVTQSTTNAAALSLTGNGTGAGISATGGATGAGISGTGGASGANGISGTGTSGGSGIRAAGGATGHGVNATGGATSGNGIIATGGPAGTGISAVGGTTSGTGLSATGTGSGAGFNVAGGTTGNGLRVIGGGTSGNGIRVTVTSGNLIDMAGVEFDAYARTALGLASANLDTQLGTIDDFLDTEIAAIKAKTDNLPSVVMLCDSDGRLIVDAHKVKWSISGATQSVYAVDGTTVNYTKTLTTNASADPITAVS